MESYGQLRRVREAISARLTDLEEDINRFPGTVLSWEIADSVRTRLESIFRHLAVVAVRSRLPDRIFALILAAIRLTESQTGCSEQPMEVSNSTYGYQCSAVSTGRRGRPRFSISQDQLEYLIGNDFPVQRIASMLGVSASTVRRRMTDFGLSISDTYTYISDEDLCSAILDIKKSSPNSGYRFVKV